MYLPSPVDVIELPLTFGDRQERVSTLKALSLVVRVRQQEGLLSLVVQTLGKMAQW